MRNTICLIIAFIIVSLSLSANEPPTHADPKAVAASVSKPAEQPKKAEEPVVPPASEKPVEQALVAPPAPVAVVVPSTATDNETIIWNFLIKNGFTREQTAGIMGNLQQEHGFQTTDVAGGLGIAQWIGGRRTTLIARGNYTDINVQLDYLMSELNGGYAKVTAIIKGSNLYGATLAFQDKFEVCHPAYCNLTNRLTYANQILARH